MFHLQSAQLYKVMNFWYNNELFSHEVMKKWIILQTKIIYKHNANSHSVYWDILKMNSVTHTLAPAFCRG